jgi:tRNA pseudouridine55 synthase
LDLFATGLMIALVGSATRLARYIVLADKSYRAGIRFGSQTDTLDPQGTILRTAPLPDPQIIRQTLDQFIGQIEQIPPEYSAIHIDGKRAYERVLAGESLEMAPRKIRIDRIDLVDYCDGLLTIDVDCSKGTYIRSLARDIGLALNSAAHLETLDRTRVGPFLVQDAHDPSGAQLPQLITGRTMLAAMPGMVSLTVDSEELVRIRHGQAFEPITNESPVALLDDQDQIIAVMEKVSNRWQYALVIPEH